MTCWRRLHEWQHAGVWQGLHEVLLAKLREADRIDWSRAVVDSSHVPAVLGALQTGPSPVNRRKSGSKHQLITDAAGIPLASGSRPQTATTVRSWSPSSRRSHPCAANRADRSADPPASSATAATNRNQRATTSGQENPAGHREAQHLTRLWARQTTLRRRAHHFLAPSPTPTAADSLRAPCRYSRSIRVDRPQPDLLEGARAGILRRLLYSPIHEGAGEALGRRRHLGRLPA